MDLHTLMTIPPQPPLFLSPNFSQLSTQKSKSLAMNQPRTQFSHTYDHYINNPFPKNDSRLSQNNETCSNSSDQEFVQFRPIFFHQELVGNDDSGVCSPPLWKNSPSPPRSPSQPLLSHRSLSPNSRIQAITRGQRELMEMVKNMPESSYELSLKDLVEHHKIETQTTQSKNQNLHQRGVVKVKRQESKKNDKNMVRIESFESKGLFLKVCPFTMKSKKKNNFLSNSNGIVSPKPEVAKSGGERDWWKKKVTGSSDSDSSRTSNNSGSTGSNSSGGGSSSGRSDGGGGRKKNGLLTGCWPFFLSRRSKSLD